MKYLLTISLFLLMTSIGFTQSIDAYPQHVYGNDIFVRVKINPGASWNGTSVPVTLYTPTCYAGMDVFVPQSKYGQWITVRFTVPNNCSGSVEVRAYSMPLSVEDRFNVNLY